jgi:hypothetical protein
MRLLVNGTERSFNPLHFVLLPEGLRAIERRNAYMRAPFLFFQERALPLSQTSQIDLGRYEYQQVFMDSYNRVCPPDGRGGRELFLEHSHTQQ